MASATPRVTPVTRSGVPTSTSEDVHVADTNVSDALSRNHQLIIHRSTKKTLESIELEHINTQISSLSDRFAAVKGRFELEGTLTTLPSQTQPAEHGLGLSRSDHKLHHLQRFYNFHCVLNRP